MIKLKHIHIGKCAGGSVNSALGRCGIEFEELHCGDANLRLEHLLKEDAGSDRYLITVRDPVQRFISSFNFDKYEKTIKRECINRKWLEIYEQFHSVDELIGGYFLGKSEIRRLAEHAIFESKLHMHLKISWYIPPALAEKLPNDRTHLIRTESVVEDFNEFLRAIERSDKVDSMPKSKDSSSFVNEIGIKNPKHLSNENLRVLKSLLLDDYRTLGILCRKLGKPFYVF